MGFVMDLLNEIEKEELEKLRSTPQPNCDDDFKQQAIDEYEHRFDPSAKPKNWNQ